MNEDALRKRGKRLKLLISMTGLEVIHFAQLTQIGLSTIRNWMKGRANGLSEKGAKKVCQFLLQNNIQCDLNWLMYQKGDLPRFNPTRREHSFPSSPFNFCHHDNSLFKERQLFLSQYADAIVAVVPNDSMKPLLEQDDHVGGIFLNENNLPGAIGKNCIVMT